MSTFVMSYRARGHLRMQPLLASTLQQAWDRAFDLAQTLGMGPHCGFAVHRTGA